MESLKVPPNIFDEIVFVREIELQASHDATVAEFNHVRIDFENASNQIGAPERIVQSTRTELENTRNQITEFERVIEASATQLSRYSQLLHRCEPRTDQESYEWYFRWPVFYVLVIVCGADG